MFYFMVTWFGQMDTQSASQTRVSFWFLSEGLT